MNLVVDRRAYPAAMPWRHHDSDIGDPFPEGGFSDRDVERLRGVRFHSDLLLTLVFSRSGFITLGSFLDFCRDMPRLRGMVTIT